MSTPAAMSSPEYLALKAEILSAFQEYNKKLAESSGYASNFYSFAGMATDMCEKTARFLPAEYRVHFLADKEFHPPFFKIRSTLENLVKWASSNQKTFAMPSFYPALRTLGNQIYAQQRAELAAAATAATTDTSTEASSGAVGVAAAVTTAVTANTASSKGSRPTRGRKAPKTPEIVPDTDSDPDEVSFVTEDVTMSDGTGLSTAERLSLNKMPTTSVVVKDLYGVPIDTTVPKSLKRQKFKEPSALSTGTSAKALDTTKSGQDEIAAKRFKANHPSEDYSKIGKDATLAFNTSADRIAASISAFVGPAATSTLKLALDTTGKPVLTATEASLVAKE
ncbi:hypothetical protein BDP27DRAFT_1406386, partial [Rhodocollybia butyracea]